MEIGKKRRLSRIFRSNGKTVIVPMDHGVSIGPVKGIVNMQWIADRLILGEADAVVVHKGIASRVNFGKMGIIVHLSGSTSLGPDLHWKVKVCSIKQALRLGADGVSVHVNVGATQEPRMLEYLGKIADKAAEFGIPLLAMMYPRGPKIQNEHDVELVKHAARVGAELGADIVKTNYTGSIKSFREVVESCPVPIVIAGGPKTKNEVEFLSMVYDSIEAGAVGVSIGRNVFQHEDPAKMVKALNAIVHENSDVERALKILKEG
ncbi:MAG: 2-amino-3,7-dideoxy-D-threo-hept-6-ulosonate synthase [Candidatus Bathyarchaeota archaeon]